MTVKWVNIGRGEEPLNFANINLLVTFTKNISQCYLSFKHSPNKSSNQFKCRKSEF